MFKSVDSYTSLDYALKAHADRDRPLLFAANAQCQALNSIPRAQGRERWKPHIDSRFKELLEFKDPRAQLNFTNIVSVERLA